MKTTCLALLLVAGLAGACDAPDGDNAASCAAPEVVTLSAVDQSTVVVDRGFVSAKAHLDAGNATLLVRLSECAAAHGIAVAVAPADGALLWVTARARDSHVVDEARTGGGRVELTSGPDVRFIGITVLGGASFSGDVTITVLP